MDDTQKPNLGTLCDVVSIATQAKVSFMPWKLWKVSETHVPQNGQNASFTVQNIEDGASYRVTVTKEQL